METLFSLRDFLKPRSMACINLGLSNSRAATLRYERNGLLQGEAHGFYRFSVMSCLWQRLSSQSNSGDLGGISSWCRAVCTSMASAAVAYNAPQMSRNSSWPDDLKLCRSTGYFKVSVQLIATGLPLRECPDVIMGEYMWQTLWSAGSCWKSSCFGILMLLSFR